MRRNRNDEDDVRRNRQIWLFSVEGLMIALIVMLVVVDRSNFRSHSYNPLFMTIALLLIACTVVLEVFRQYLSIRYLQLPAWRLMTRWFREKRDTRDCCRGGESRESDVRKHRTRRDRLCFWLGNTCLYVGMALFIYLVVWRCIAGIEHESKQKPLPYILGAAGFLIFMFGARLVKLSRPKNTPKDHD